MDWKFEIFGRVQGVGFRPFIYRLATHYGVKGEVFNDGQGVQILASGTEQQLADFEKAIFNELPPLASIEKLLKTPVPAQGFTSFKIKASSHAGQNRVPILPDFSMCDACQAELRDRSNPRFHYPFINCTQCGPRLSIIKTLPYDRHNTTMASFHMCAFCQSEYSDPSNRRYHAEPISCPNCGPTLSLKNKNGDLVAQGQAVFGKVAQLLEQGKILAVKGLGGFHLMVDATSEQAVQTLRDRKHRPSKPLAIMCQDENMARQIAHICTRESESLNSNLKPIVILDLKTSQTTIAPNIAPDLNKVGIFLPPTALHWLMFEHFHRPLVATSANISGEPIIFTEEDLRQKLGDVIDFYLDHDRDIVTPSDDSIVQIVNTVQASDQETGVTVQEQVQCLRTSRGMNPQIFWSDFAVKGTFLALGAELKNQFALYKDGEIFISPYIGDLKNVLTFERFFDLLTLFEKTYDLRFDAVIADLHPHFLHTKEFEKRGYPIYRIAHHHAHLLSALAENKLLREHQKYLGFSFDGTGYGDDGMIWGGEVMHFDAFSYQRLAHIEPFSLIGGEKAIKNTYKLALSLIFKFKLEAVAQDYLSHFEASELSNLRILEKKSVQTTSMGRLFDAFAAVILGLKQTSYDGQAGMRLESLYMPDELGFYDFPIENGEIKIKPAFEQIFTDSPPVAASKLINGIAKLIANMAQSVDAPVVLSGGVFQNKTLMAQISQEFKRLGKVFFTHLQNPTNDSGIAYGQLVGFLRQRESPKDR